MVIPVAASLEQLQHSPYNRPGIQSQQPKRLLVRANIIFTGSSSHSISSSRLIRNPITNSRDSGAFHRSQETRAVFLVASSGERGLLLETSTSDEERNYTLDEAIESLGVGRFQVLILFYAGMSWVAEAMEMMLLSFAGPAVQRLWTLSPEQESFIASVVFAGMMIGAYSWGVLSDSKGRRAGFFATAVLTFVAGMSSAFAPNYYALLFFRALVGVGLGGGPVVSSWFMEFIPSSSRGTLMVIFSVFWTIGSIAEAALAWLIMPRLGWRWLLGCSSLPLLVLLLFYPIVPESPRYFAAKGDLASALGVLKKVATLNRTCLPPGTLISSRGEDSTSRAELEAASDHRSPMKKGFTGREDSGFISAFSKLLSPALLKSTLLLWLVFFANAFTYYGLVLLTSQVSEQAGACIGEATTLSNTQPGEPPVYRDVLITSFAELPGLAAAAAIVDRYGRKSSMAALFIACGLCLVPLLHHQSEPVTTFCLFGARACITGSFTILSVYAPELYPTSSRATGLGTASSFARIGGMLCPLVAVAMVRSCHQSEAVFLFILVSLLAAAMVFLLPIETKGRALTDDIKHDGQAS